MGYIHLRDESKPSPTIEECLKKFKRIRKKEDTDNIVLKIPKEVKKPEVKKPC